MVILQVDIEGVAIFKSERDPVILGDGDSPFASTIALKRVQAESGSIHAIDGLCCVENIESDLNPLPTCRMSI